MKQFIIITLLALGMIGCSNSKNAPQLSETAKQNILSVNIGANPSFLNPVLFTDSTSHAVVRLVFNGLFKQTVDLEMEPDLVESYTISDDGLIYTFELHKKCYLA